MDGGSALPSGTAQPALPLAEALRRCNPDQRAPRPALAREDRPLRYPAQAPSPADRCNKVARNHYGGSAWEGSRESPSRREIRRYGRSLKSLSRSKSRRGRYRCRQWRGRPPRSEHDRPTAPPRPDRSLHRLSYSTPDATNLVSQLSCTGIMVARPPASAMMLSPEWKSLPRRLHSWLAQTPCFCRWIATKQAGEKDTATNS